MKTLILFFVLTYTALQAFGQESILKLSSNRNSDNSVNITYEKPDEGSVTVELKFRELGNSNTPRTVFSVKGTSGTLLTLKPIHKDNPIQYSYTYRSIRGALLPKMDTSYVYLLPYVASENVRVSEAGFLRAKYFGAEEPLDWKVYHFYTDKPATVVASRKGTVVSIKDGHDDSKLEGVAYSSKTNNIYVEHTDGTLLEYDGFENGSIKVKVGDVVFPGQPLGTNVKRRDNQYSIVYSLSYLKNANLLNVDNKTMNTSESYYGWITPVFRTVDGDSKLDKNKRYTSVIPEELVTKEMSKKELKKYQK